MADWEVSKGAERYAALADDIAKNTRPIRDFKPGIVFRDVTTILQNPRVFAAIIDAIVEYYRDANVQYIAGFESRGFVFGAPVAYKMNLPFVMLRKKGKLPHKVMSVEYQLEYGTDALQVHEDAVQKGGRVLLVDDLLATGGTLGAGAQLIDKLGGVVVGAVCPIELPALRGRERLAPYGFPIFSIVSFVGE